MIIVTGGLGFIGYNLTKKLVELGYDDIVIIDNRVIKYRVIENDNKKITYLNVEDSFLWFGFNKYDIDFVFHLGACADTTEKDVKIFNYYNLNYSKFIWNICSENQIPLIYASSAATYGDGEDGFDDDILPEYLKPLNPYGESKNNFDIWMLEKIESPPFWAALKFFNVYGIHEVHKGKMASVILHFYQQIKKTGEVKLFRSHVNYCEDGMQKRDFIHVDDVVNTMIYMFKNQDNVPSDIYNLGTGFARTYNDLAKAIFKSLGKPEKISYIDTPLEIRDSYQYYTRAKMDKLRSIMLCDFNSLEEGIDLYIKQLEHENC